MSYNIPNNSENSKIIHINSVDATNIRQTNFTTDFEFEFDDSIICPENQEMLISCNGLSCPYTFYNIRDNVNNKLPVRYSGQLITLSLTPGNYNTTTFALEVKNKFDTAMGPVTINIVYNKSRMKYQIFSATAGVDFDTSQSTLTPHIELGILPNTNLTLQTAQNEASFTQNVLDINGSIHGLYFRTDLTSNSILESNTKALSTILARVPIRVNFGGVIFYDSIEGNTHKTKLDKREIKNIHIRLTDERNRLINLNGNNFTCSIQIDFIYKQSKIPELTKISRRKVENFRRRKKF